MKNLMTKPLQLPHSFSADDACASATEFLLDNIGNQLTVGQPLRMVSAIRSTWIVPIQLAYVHTGILGSVGVIAVDEETGQVVGWTPVDQIKETSRQLREQNKPQLSDQFESLMSVSTKWSSAVVTATIRAGLASNTWPVHYCINSVT